MELHSPDREIGDDTVSLVLTTMPIAHYVARKSFTVLAHNLTVMVGDILTFDQRRMLSVWRRQRCIKTVPQTPLSVRALHEQHWIATT